MIHYALRCTDGHEFDGWFRSAATFEQQAVAGLLECPSCASTAVGRALMAPNLSSGAPAPAQPPAPPPGPDTSGPATPSAGTANPATAGSATPGPATPGPATPGPATPGKEVAVGGPPAIPDAMRAMLQRIRSEVERRCDYVGAGFAQTARAMHAGAEPPRPIYGETTPDQAAALAEDGIEVSSIPWLPRADS